MTVKDYDKIIKDRLSSKRYEHSKNVAKEAVRLAKKYGADVQKAEIAGILHDITKEAEQKEQFDVIEKAGIELTELERSTPKLWHAISGSAYIKVILGIDDEDIINAIRFHTTGRCGMSLLEKVIFIADFTSAERDYDGVEKMRKAADKSLEEAMIEGMSFTICDLADRKLPIAPDTFKGYNEVVFAKSKKNK
ncbi:MAG: bis(5'-nucleosyl)-tetraphosphatase (symmetrical) YqeK [Clostridia bacterium]|nr:bis(5'-nucleosyl)-tetraphosphatase (symmetrical) YqeK [Clostridia bacterium]